MNPTSNNHACNKEYVDNILDTRKFNVANTRKHRSH